jgi:hypothetical protein
MFVVATLVAIPLGWIAYSLNWISERRYALANGACRIGTTRAPAGLWLLGEEGSDIVFFGPEPPDGPDAEARRLRRLFPEADVQTLEEVVNRPRK